MVEGWEIVKRDLKNPPLGQVVTRVWLKNDSGEEPAVFLEIEGRWEQVLSTADLKHQRNLICELERGSA